MKKYVRTKHKHAFTNIRVHKYPLTRAHVYAYVFASCARVRGRILTKKFLVVPYFVMNLSLKFQ